MRKAFILLIIYTCLIISLYSALVLCISSILNKDSLYKIPQDKTVFVIGNSHTAYDINDSILSYSYNLSSPADAFSYSYAKLKKILPLNKNIKVVLMSCSEEDITAWIEKIILPILTDVQVGRYFYLMSPGELFYVLARNPKMVIKTLIRAPKSQKIRCIQILKSKMNLKGLELGGYESLNGRINIEKELKRRANNDNMADVNQRQVDYLHKIISLCKLCHVKIILVRAPEYRLFVRKNEKIFLDLLHEQFNDITFKDYVNMNLSDTCFYDIDHLNHYGAAIFTDTINSYLSTLLRADNS
jgi:hypothetical protein